MAEIDLRLHPGQLKVWQSPARFKVVVAGRRWGKTDLAVKIMLMSLLETESKGYDLHDAAILYIAPTYDQARTLFWDRFINLAGPALDKVWINEGKFQSVNGRVGYIRGADIPDRLRGIKLAHVVLDEWAFTKPEAWEYILRPALSDVEGGATFIGTPDPAARNHFYDLALAAELDEDWEAFHFKTRDNPFINPREIEAAKRQMSTQAFLAEYEASFDTHGGRLLDPTTIQEGVDPGEGDVYVAVDPAGYRDVSGLTLAQQSRLDETAIAVVKVHPLGWHILDIIHGRWPIAETGTKILRAAQRHKALQIGIERATLSHAIRPVLEDQKRRLGIPINIVDLPHSNTNKTSRITWALQGRFERDRITCEPGPWVERLRSQAFDFPDGRHDDLLDALAYIDHMATTRYDRRTFEDTWEPMDAAVGY